MLFRTKNKRSGMLSWSTRVPTTISFEFDSRETRLVLGDLGANKSINSGAVMFALMGLIAFLFGFALLPARWSYDWVAFIGMVIMNGAISGFLFWAGTLHRRKLVLRRTRRGRVEVITRHGRRSIDSYRVGVGLFSVPTSITSFGLRCQNGAAVYEGNRMLFPVLFNSPENASQVWMTLIEFFGRAHQHDPTQLERAVARPRPISFLSSPSFGMKTDYILVLDPTIPAPVQATQ